MIIYIYIYIFIICIYIYHLCNPRQNPDFVKNKWGTQVDHRFSLRGLPIQPVSTGVVIAR